MEEYRARYWNLSKVRFWGMLEFDWSLAAAPYSRPHLPHPHLQTFNPTKFDAKSWAATAKAAGMRYFVM